MAGYVCASHTEVILCGPDEKILVHPELADLQEAGLAPDLNQESNPFTMDTPWVQPLPGPGAVSREHCIHCAKLLFYEISK